MNLHLPRRSARLNSACATWRLKIILAQTLAIQWRCLRRLAILNGLSFVTGVVLLKAQVVSLPLMLDHRPGVVQLSALATRIASVPSTSTALGPSTTAEQRPAG